MEHTIVPLREGHLGALEKLERECFAHPWTRAGLEAELHSDTALFLVCEENGEAAGYVGSHLVCGECYIDNVAVSPAFRRRGVGRALLCALLEECTRQKAEFLSLEVRESNAPALALYQSLGFGQAGRRRGFYSAPPEDALIFTRFLRAEQD